MSEFGRMLGLSRQTVAAYVALGMPAGPAARGAEGRRIPFAAARQWIEDRAAARARAADGGETQAQAELRKLRADADLAEAKVAALREQMVPTAVARTAMAAVMATADARMTQMVERVAPMLATEADPAVVRHLLFLASREARQEMADDLAPDGEAAS